jgi:spore germination cell wall hydrolase CwlJ-like protein
LFGALAITLLPTQVAYQDLGALLAHQRGVAERWHEHLIDSPFGTIHAATFSMAEPIGTDIPHPPVYALANFDPLDVAASIGAEVLGDPNAPVQFPRVNRKDKRDSLLSRARAPMPPLPPLLAIQSVPQVQVDAPLVEENTAGRFDPYSQYEFASVPDESAPEQVVAPVKPAELKSMLAKPDAAKHDTRIFFGARPMAGEQDALRPYAPGEAPMQMLDGDADIKMASLSPPSDGGAGGESYANKGEVTGEGQRPVSPAERLGLNGADRAKQEKCLANAVYFEARGEQVRGQIAVAQVVMNRVFSPFYPKTVCGVVYQNANRHLACQFTFACDGVPDVVTEPDAWLRATRIAKDMLDGKLWLPEVAKSTHYHAYWVHPDWVNEMKKIYRLGVHTFYRPRAWGDGSDEPSWGDPKTTAAETKKLDKM